MGERKRERKRERVKGNESDINHFRSGNINSINTECNVLLE